MKIHLTRRGRLTFSDGACPRALCLRHVDAWRQTTDPEKVTCLDCREKMRKLDKPQEVGR